MPIITDKPEYSALKKVELHCHLDGSLEPATLWQWAKEAGLDDSPDLQSFRRRVEVPEECPDLKTYLDRFELPCACLQKPEHLTIAAYELIRQAAKENVIYLEMRYAPYLHEQGMSPEASVEAVLEGLHRGEKEFGVVSRLLLCALRGLDGEDHQKHLVDLAVKYRDQGVGGLDLAGNEAAYPLDLYIPFFTAARKRNVRFTVHAGEAGDPTNVSRAVALGATRLGHGLATVRDVRLIELCVKNQVLLEMCPTSNLQTKAWTDLANYPLATLHRLGIPCCLNTDNRTVSATTLEREYRLFHEYFEAADEAYYRELNHNALAHAFVEDSLKRELAMKLR